MNNSNYMRISKRAFRQLTLEANELINCGNSKEKAEGHGMKNVLDNIKSYGKRTIIKKSIGKGVKKGNDSGSAELD